jgi:uncharacterized membrane protein
LFGIAANILFKITFWGIMTEIHLLMPNERKAALGILGEIVFATSVIYLVISSVGIWRSARKYFGPVCWKLIARSIVVLNLGKEVFHITWAILATSGLLTSPSTSIITH